MQQTIFGAIMIVILAIMFLGIFIPAFFVKPDASAGNQYVLAIDSGLPAHQQTLLNYLELLMKRDLLQQPQVITVIYGKGLSILAAHPQQNLARIQQLRQTGVEFCICRASLQRLPANKQPAAEILSRFRLVDNGKAYVNELMDQGYINDFA